MSAPMKYAVIKITMEELRTLPVDAALAYFAVGQINNDLGTLFKLTIRSLPKQDDPELVRLGSLTMSVLFLRLAAGRLYEAWATLSRHVNKVERDFKLLSQMPQENQQQWLDLKRYFSQPNLVKDIRDKVAFHNDTDKGTETLDSLPQDAEFWDYHFEHAGNSLFAGAELAQLANISKVAGSTDLVSGFNLVSDHVIQRSKQMTNFCWAFLRVFLQHFFPEKLRNQVLLSMEPVPEKLSNRLSYFYSIEAQT